MEITVKLNEEEYQRFEVIRECMNHTLNEMTGSDTRLSDTAVAHSMIMEIIKKTEEEICR